MAASVGIYLSTRDSSAGFRVPIAPETLAVERDGDGDDFTISKTGAVNVPKPAKLKTFSIESFFPAMPTHYSDTEFAEPSSYISKIEKWQDDEEVLRFIFVNGSFEINELVTIQKFTYSQSFGTEDVDFKLDFKKYVPFEPKKMKVVKPPSSAPASKSNTNQVVKQTAPPRETEKPKPQTYSLVKGDSLWKVAQKYTGNGNNYGELQKLNGIKDSDLRRLPIGLTLKIPTSWTEKKK